MALASKVVRVMVYQRPYSWEIRNLAPVGWANKPEGDNSLEARESVGGLVSGHIFLIGHPGCVLRIKKTDCISHSGGAALHGLDT